MPVGVFPGFTSNAIWGAISGDITDQTDLQAALDGKQDAILSAVLSADFPKTNQTLANVTGLTLTLTAGHWYRVTGEFYMDGSGGGGIQWDFNGGSATATVMDGGCIGWQVDAAAVTFQRASSLGFGFDDAAGGFAPFDFTIQVNVGGTLIPRFAQQSTNAAASNMKKSATITAQDITP